MNDEAACRICFSGKEAGELIRPCSCQGSMQWVHAECLEQWWQSRVGGTDANLDFSARGLRCEVCGATLAVEKSSEQWTKCLYLKALCIFPWRLLGNACWNELNFMFHMVPVAIKEMMPVVPVTLLTAWWLISELNRAASLSAGSHFVLDLGRWFLPLLLWWNAAILSISFSPNGTQPPRCMRVFLQEDADRLYKQLLSFSFSGFIISFFTLWPHVSEDSLFDAIPWRDTIYCLLPGAAFLLVQLARRCTCVNSRLVHMHGNAQNDVLPPPDIALNMEYHVLCVAAILTISWADCMGAVIVMAADIYILKIEMFVILTFGVAMEVFHSILMLRIVCAPRTNPIGAVQSRIWARIGVIVIIWISSLAILSCSTSIFWKYVGLLVPWGLLVIGMCVWIGAPVWDEGRAWMSTLCSSIKGKFALWHWQMWLESRSVRFTDRPNLGGSQEPLIRVAVAD